MSHITKDEISPETVQLLKRYRKGEADAEARRRAKAKVVQTALSFKPIERRPATTQASTTAAQEILSHAAYFNQPHHYEGDIQMSSESEKVPMPMGLRWLMGISGFILACASLIGIMTDTPERKAENERLWRVEKIEIQRTKQIEAGAQLAPLQGLNALPPSQVPANQRAETFPSVSSAVPCTAGGQGLASEGFSNPVTISSGFELEPGKCFFARPTAPPRQLEGSNALMELYNSNGSLIGRCEFKPAFVTECLRLHGLAVAGQGVLRFVALHGGFIKYWV